jgi:NAD(P)-dependent dehydrogenase (short-subunit alcohol dehydrogenase family)
MAREGADITIVYLPQEQEDAEDTKGMVEKEGRECLLVAGDLMDYEVCKRAVEEHVKKYVGLFFFSYFLLFILCVNDEANGVSFFFRYSRINVLVNNAGKQIMCPNFEEIDLDNVESTFRSNILQAFAITKYALPYMTKGDSYVNAPIFPL